MATRQKSLFGARSAGNRSAPRRRVQRDYQAGDQVGFKLKSLTEREGETYHPAIDITTREYHCDCKDHQFRTSFCKHLRRCAVLLIKDGVIPRNWMDSIGVKACYCCGTQNDIYPVVDNDGRTVHDVFICHDCAASLCEWNDSKRETPVVESREVQRLRGLLLDAEFWVTHYQATQQELTARGMVQEYGVENELHYWVGECDRIQERLRSLGVEI